MRTLSLAVGVCLALCSAAAVPAQADPTLVYFANGETIYRFDPDDVACVGNLSCIDPVLFLPGAELRGLNYGPDESLYWCDAATGRVGRWRLNDAAGTRVNEVFFTYPAADPNNLGPAQPRCGWFNHLGGFAVTDGADGGVWLFPELADYERDFDDPNYDPNYTGAPVQILATGTAGLEGITQYIDGDLLLVRPGAKKKSGPKGAVLCSEFDSFLPGSQPPLGPPPPCYPFDTLIGDLRSPRGVAVADGYIFVTDDRRLQRFDSLGALKEACADFGRNTPLLLAATVDGRLYVGTESNRDGRIYRVDFDGGGCQAPVLLQTLPKNLGYAPAVTGVAVTQTHETVTRTVALTPEGTYEAAFTFNGANVWELTAGQGCRASITGFLTPPARVQEAIDAIVVNDPNDPNANTVLGKYVNFFGDNGNAYVWRQCGETADGATNCPDLADTCPAGAGAFYRFLTVGNLPLLLNGRLGVCDPAALPDPTSSFCELVELTISVSFNPDLATIDPVGGRRGSGSDYYLLDVSTGNANVPGFFCGFQSPITEADPPAQFSIGDTIPVKFRLARLTDAMGNPIPPDCQNGPFITQEAIALLSVAQLEPFKVKKRIFANGAGQNEPAYFQGPSQPSQSFHYNLDTNGFNPGLHLLEVAFPYDTETVKQVLIVMVP